MEFTNIDKSSNIIGSYYTQRQFLIPSMLQSTPHNNSDSLAYLCLNKTDTAAATLDGK